MTTSVQYLRNPGFDNFFTWGIPLIAALSVAFVMWRPELLFTVILLDLSLLGYHHVIATFTRFQFTEDRAAENRMLLLYLPPLVLTAVIGLTLTAGVVWVTTLYLHWQWWHYTRQSEGVSKAYSMKNECQQAGHPMLNRLTFYAVPVATFLSMSSRNPETFIFMKVTTLPVPEKLALVLVILASLLFLQWLVLNLKATITGQLPPLVFVYFVSHYLIYYFAYHFIQDVTVGWLLINIWHNMQYIAFVWACNVNQFGSGKANINRVKAWLCQPKHWFIYFAICYFLTKFIYDGLDQLINLIPWGTAAVLTVIIYQTVNFHHYIVDTLIWKMRKSTVRNAVGINTSN